MKSNVRYAVLISTISIIGCSLSSNTSTPTEAAQISSNDTNSTNETPVPLDTIREDLLHELAGYQSESLAEKMYELVANVETTATAVQLQGVIVSTEVVSFDEPSTRNSFDCPFGGTMVTETINSDTSLGGPAIESSSYDQYTFDQCVTAINGGSLPDGNYELNGSYTDESILRSSSSGSYRNSVATWGGFNLQQAGGLDYAFEGTLTLTTSGSPQSTVATRDSQIIRYVESSDTSPTLELTGVDFYQSRQPFIQPQGGVEGPRTVRINGRYTGPLSQEDTLQISTDLEFTEWKSADAEFNEPLTGSLQISSTDGGVLTMIATNGPLAISFLSPDGTTTESTLAELPVFDFRGPGCVPEGDYINEMPIEACSF